MIGIFCSRPFAHAMFIAEAGMTNRLHEFTRTTQKLALARQKNLCASCGALITALGQAGRHAHKFGESAQAHHIKHVKLGGTNNLGNCAVICWSCHYSVHEGGNYRFGPVSGTPEDFPYFRGPRG
jgi:5-methylcytosine-specific restriction endonuclease McrA